MLGLAVQEGTDGSALKVGALSLHQKRRRTPYRHVKRRMKMDDKTTALIEKLAAKLGTTAEHLWGILLHQAPISGAVDLATVVIMVLAAIILVRFVRRKTTQPARTDEDEYPHADWEGEGAVIAWFLTAIYLVITGSIVIESVQGIVAAFINPEYWALSRILGKL